MIFDGERFGKKNGLSDGFFNGTFFGKIVG